MSRWLAVLQTLLLQLQSQHQSYITSAELSRLSSDRPAFELKTLRPLGAEVRGLDLRQQPSESVLALLEKSLAESGFLVFSDLGDVGVDKLKEISGYFGGREVISRHRVHREALSDDVLRLSNREEHGVPAVGPQWHGDGSTERSVFSHILFHAQVMPPDGGETEFTDLARAFESLPQQLKEEWTQLASVNAYSGAVHPLVHRHPVTNRQVLFLHLGQTGAIIRWEKPLPAERVPSWEGMVGMEPGLEAALRSRGFRALSQDEMISLLHRYDEQLSRPEHSGRYRYRSGDLVVVDNLATAHRAAASAHDSENGLRILHRTTVKGREPLDPPLESGLPPYMYIFGDNPFCDGGVWQASDYYGVGFRWNETVALRN